MIFRRSNSIPRCSQVSLFLVIISIWSLVLLSLASHYHKATTPDPKTSRGSKKRKSSSSLQELPKDDQLLVFYNRIPKTGSTSFINSVGYDKTRQNGFSVIHLNVSRNSHVMTLADRARLVKNVTTWQERKPALYHGHVAFVDFRKFGVVNPVYINIIRQPLDRLVSYYYFLRYGDNYRPNLTRRKAGDKETFDECVRRTWQTDSDIYLSSDCHPHLFWMQIPFFCGHSAECWEPGNAEALRIAKRNLQDHYLLVGLVNQMGEFIALLELALPRIFSGATQTFMTSRNSNLRETKTKIPPEEETLLKIRQNPIFQMEQEFFEYARKQFLFVKNRFFSEKDKSREGKKALDILAVGKNQRFHYEKIRPR